MQELLFDPVRRKHVKATPEERVRQQWLNYLIREKGVPASLIAVEKLLQYNGQSRRADIVVFDQMAFPRIVIECKAPEISITQDTFDQAAMYNQVYRADHLVVTNGSAHFCCKIDFADNSYIFVNEIPHYNDL